MGDKWWTKCQWGQASLQAFHSLLRPVIVPSMPHNYLPPHVGTTGSLEAAIPTDFASPSQKRNADTLHTLSHTRLTLAMLHERKKK
jgi:hypothetical protein